MVGGRAVRYMDAVCTQRKTLRNAKVYKKCQCALIFTANRACGPAALRTRHRV